MRLKVISVMRNAKAIWLLAGLCLAVLGWPATSLADYPNTPAAFLAGDNSIVWDNTFAKNLGNSGKQYFVLDFCDSGGFVDDLAAANRAVYCSNDWDEYGWGTARVGSTFGIPFFNNLTAGTPAVPQNIGDAYTLAAGAVLNTQLPQSSDPSAIGGNTMTFAKGDQAFIFSAAAPEIGSDCDVAKATATLISLGWSASNNNNLNPIQSFYGAAANQAALNQLYAASKSLGATTSCSSILTTMERVRTPSWTITTPPISATALLSTCGADGRRTPHTG